MACIPVTRDGKLVIGERQDRRGKKTLDLIGGTLNADEMEISNFSDFKTFMVKEFEEEVDYEVDINRLELFCVNIHSGRVEFIFTYRLDGDSSQIKLFPNDKEFSELLFFAPEELLESGIAKNDTVIKVEKHTANIN